MQDLKTAIVVEKMIAPGGGDRFLDSIARIYPNADIFTPVFNRKRYEEAGWEYEWFSRVIPFFPKIFQRSAAKIDNKGRSRQLSRWIYNILAPYSYEFLDLRKYNFVISLSARFAKSIITLPETFHLNIYLTPGRYEWDNNKTLHTHKRKLGSIRALISDLAASRFRVWDRLSAIRPDMNLAISNYVAAKVRKYYEINSQVIYPPISESWLDLPGPDSSEAPTANSKNGYFLCVSRLYDYKRIDWAIKAAHQLDQHLIVVGTGPEKSYLENLAGDSGRIEFTGFISDEKLAALYRDAKCLIFPGEEDFGYVPLEAMSQGCPVIAFHKGGAAETVIPGKTGLLFKNFDDLIEKMRKFDNLQFEKKLIRKRAGDFRLKDFKHAMMKLTADYLKSH
ncbi:glycosyltransferase [Candidatus Dojkabacteria bacterium]|nr:glycosyltransferase [Candidatus Dojkabacteria bacterium]